MRGGRDSIKGRDEYAAQSLFYLFLSLLDALDLLSQD
jgi:hypothetical protein